jgi:hypothetical protein
MSGVESRCAANCLQNLEQRDKIEGERRAVILYSNRRWQTRGR